LNTRKKDIEKNSCKSEPSREGTPVDITLLKEFVESHLPPGNPLRESILADDEEISKEAFLAKLTVWLRLSRLKRRR
jgi:hypothetical protein